MPGLNGRGPLNEGPGSGRGRGRCRNISGRGRFDGLGPGRFCGVNGRGFGIGWKGQTGNNWDQAETYRQWLQRELDNLNTIDK
ncbi:DUF5320 family protein [Syntrophomonas erecta]